MIQVTGFDLDLTYSTVLALVQPFTSAPSIRLSKGGAYITFESYLQAENARKGINGTEWEGKQLFARLVMPGAPLEAANVFVRSLPMSLTHTHLEALCPPASIILSSRISSDPSGRSQGYGYIQFLTEDMANTAIAHLNKVYIQHRPLSAQPFQSKSQRTLSSGHTVFLLNCNLREDQVRRVFETYGEVQGVAIRKKETGVVTSVTLGSRESAVQAVKGVDGRPWVCSLRPYLGD